MTNCNLPHCKRDAVFHFCKLNRRQLEYLHHYCSEHGADVVERFRVHSKDEKGRGTIGKLPGAVCFDLECVAYHDFSPESWMSMREIGGYRCFAFRSGYNDATSLVHRVQHSPYPRPMTHDAFLHTISLLGGQLGYVVIDDVIVTESVFHAKAFIRQGNQDLQSDMRPTDAVVLAVTSNVPIFVTDHVLTINNNAPWAN